MASKLALAKRPVSPGSKKSRGAGADAPVIDVAERADSSYGRVAAVLFALACTFAVPSPAHAWGAEGHRIVARLAKTQLSPAAMEEVTKLLALEPGATLESVSTWADEFRSPSTAPWHYVNFPRGGDCKYDAPSLCADGQCVVGAIERQLAVLASTASGEDRLKALKYVVHFVGDVHQPLHAGYADDNGGNGYQLQAFGRGTNLHSLWDSDLIANWPGGPAALFDVAVAEKSTVGGAKAPPAWAEDSCHIVGQDGFYPADHKLDPECPQRWSAVLVQQLVSAGSRLAGVLNTNLARP
jgi:hypothetical protein